MSGNFGDIVPGRECGECTLCCKLLGVPSIGKAPGVWCTHCTAKGGCAIYETRPQRCRDFNCAWLRAPALDERWKPSVCKFVVSLEEGGLKLKVAVEPARPDVWRKEPFYSYFKNWVRHNAVHGGELLVMIGKRAIVMLPDGEVDLGLCGDDDRIVLARTDTPLGPRFEALKLHKDDPRVQVGHRWS